ncbi:MAG: fasciclin domain-containing protein [Ilumatobacteraceae bacterium]|nr:fasciclin domain-containing protein [Ilumatobacteraceae bacterium]
MVSPSTQPASRYRRRILGLGALATGALYVIGAPIFNGRIESDLEQRVPTELAAAGFAGLTASFSGQDGTLTCTAPLDDPESARAAAYDVRGVRAIELDRSCRVNTAASTGDDASVEADDAVAETTTATTRVATTVAATDPSDTNPDADLVTVSDIVAANPDLAFLSVLLADTDIGRSSDPITLFAPSNTAFDAVPADVLSRLQNDPTLLAEVLSHHVVEGTYTTTDFVDGDLMAGDGNTLRISADDVVTVNGAILVSTDILASNGVVHVIDEVLLSADVLAERDTELAPAAITYDGSSMLLTGVVASEVERQAIVAAAVAAVGTGGVTDQLTVDPDTGVEAGTAAQLGELVRAMPDNLLSGESGFNGTDLYANGVPRSPAGRDAFTAAAAAVGVEADLIDPPDASEDDADDLEAQLNAFVTENPILFEPSSAVLSESAIPIIDRVADDALSFGGISITVEGHTDSDGQAIENLQLSQNRAEAVRAALIERGLSPEAVDAVGFGSDRPIVVEGVEDKNASRRVEFRVVTTT